MAKVASVQKGRFFLFSFKWGVAWRHRLLLEQADLVWPQVRAASAAMRAGIATTVMTYSQSY